MLDARRTSGFGASIGMDAARKVERAVATGPQDLGARDCFLTPRGVSTGPRHEKLCTDPADRAR